MAYPCVLLKLYLSRPESVKAHQEQVLYIDEQCRRGEHWYKFDIMTDRTYIVFEDAADAMAFKLIYSDDT